MKFPALFLQIFLLLSLCSPLFSAELLDTNAPAGQTGLPLQLPGALPVIPELDELREQLRDMQRSNAEMQRSSEEASVRWQALLHQNLTLSNVLSGLQQTLIGQRERDLELGKQSNALTIRVIAGAAVAVFLVFLFSYWFQLRCLNRVMELSRSHVSVSSLPPHQPALLEQETASSSKLLNAMKLLEHRLQQLETPESSHENGTYSETPAALKGALMNSGVSAPVPSPSMALLLAKGQVLLDTDRLNEAFACFQEAIAVDSTHSEAHLKKGITLERMNRLEPALAAYEEALRLNPKRAVANVNKARVLAALHRYDEAISVYDSALGRNPSKGETPIFTS